MATEYEGNVLRPPGMGAVKTVSAPEEALAAYNPPPLKKGGTVQAGAGVLRVCEPLKYDGSGYLVKSVLTAGAYDQVDAVNVTAVDCTTEAHEVNVLFSGVINAKVAAVVGNEDALATALGGTYNAQFGWIRF